MGTLHEAYWLSDGQGQTRKERQSGAYRYYLPAPLAKLDIKLSTDTVSDIVRAETAIRELNARVRVLHGNEGLARLLMRAESVSSSFIEGLQVGAKRLLKAELDLVGKENLKADPVAIEIISNIHAMEDALNEAESRDSITVDAIRKIHVTLFKRTRLDEYGGVVRSEQNWIGGTWHNPLQAKYVPPAPEHLEALLEDLTDYCNQTLVSPVQQAALVHAQFETIHPFVDGNGRTGRALIHLVLRRRGLTPVFVPPISLILATFNKDYVSGLTDFRFSDDEDAEIIHNKLNDWISFFAGACVRACEQAFQFEGAAEKLQNAWREKLGNVRKGSSAELLLDELIGSPLFTYQLLQERTGRSLRAIIKAIEDFEKAGIVKPTGNAQRKRNFEVPEVLRAYNILERQLASPARDTRSEKPNRPVPDKNQRSA